MQVAEQTLEGAVFDAQVTSHRADGWAVVIAFGAVIARWPESDPIAADTFIAAALLAGWRGKTVAALAFCSQTAVSRVRTRVSETGFAGLAQPARPGRLSALAAKQFKHAMDLREEGRSFWEIAEVFGVAKTSIVRRLRGVPAGPSKVPVQISMPVTIDERVRSHDDEDDARDARDDDTSITSTESAPTGVPRDDGDAPRARAMSFRVTVPRGAVATPGPC